MLTFVHHDGALGDGLLSLPCFRKLREEPGKLHFAGHAGLGRLLKECGMAEETSDPGAGRYAGLYSGQPGQDLAKFLSQFDRAVLFTVNAGGPAGPALSRAIADTKVVVTIPPEGARISAARYRFSQLSSEAFPESGPLLSVPPSHRELASAMLLRWGWKDGRPLVMVHPGSGGENKRWPLDRFFSLIRALPEAFVVIFTGPAEDDRFLDRVEAFCRDREGAVHAGDADLSALAALLSLCSVYAGNDSGVSHLAAAVGAPVVALFGPTDPVVWGPVGRDARILSASRLEDISVEQAADAVRTSLASAAMK